MAEYISLEKALSKVKSGDYIVTGLGAAEGREFMTKLHTVADKIKKTVTVSNCLPMGDYEFFSNPAYTVIITLSLHDALPISPCGDKAACFRKTEYLCRSGYSARQTRLCVAFAFQHLRAANDR